MAIHWEMHKKFKFVHSTRPSDSQQKKGPAE